MSALWAPRETAAQMAVGGRAEDPGASIGAGQSLSSRLGLSVGRNLVYSADPDDRLRAVDRLASLETPEAIEALLEAMETGSPLARDPAARLAVVRALAKFAGRQDVRAFLVREMMDAGARRDVTSGLAALVRDTAALALARRGDAEAIQALATAGALRGPAGEAARAAMIAVPPRILDAILFEPPDEEGPSGGDADGEEAAASKKKPPPRPDGEVVEEDKKKLGKKTPRVLTAPVIAFLGELGDVRAMPSIREELDRADRPTRAAAALALAKLGDGSVAKAVASWLDENDPRFAFAAAEVLVVLGDPGAPAAVKKMLDKEAVRSLAVRLAYELASPETADAVAKLLPSLDPPDRIRAVMALGRSGAAAKVAELVADPTVGPAAVTALGLCPSATAEDVIAKGLEQISPKRRLFARAAVMRWIVLRDAVAGLDGALAELAKSKDASDVEVGTFGLVARGDLDLEDVVASKAGEELSLAALSGAARGALARDPGQLAPLAKELEKLDPRNVSERQIAAGVVLLSSAAADSLSFLKLLEIAESGGALASLAARALPRRADESMKERLLALLGGTDPTVRVGLAIGLAESPHKSAVSWLTSAYAREDDVQVRRAIVASLAARTEVQRERVLQMASALDPDAEVRAIANAALAGTQPPHALRTAGVDSRLAAFFSVVGADGTTQPAAMRLVLPSGVALPLVTAKDGGLLVAGVPFGKSSLELVHLPKEEKSK